MSRSAAVILFGLAAVLFPAAALAQGGWGKTDDGYHLRFKDYAQKAEQEILRGNWGRAQDHLKSMKWYLDVWKRRGLEQHPNVAAAEYVYLGMADRVAKKESVDPSASRRVRYVRREGGKPQGGGASKGEPAKFLWRELKEGKPGDTYKISGPEIGWRGDGKIEIAQPHVTLEGGWSPDFAARDPVKHPTWFHRPEATGTKAASLQSWMFDVKAGTGFTLDGWVLDQRNHNVYRRNGNLDLEKSISSPILRVTFTGKVAIKNCVFVNGSYGGLRLIARGAGDECVVENCLFINCVGFGIEAYATADHGAKFVFKNNTFALILPRRSELGTGIRLGARGTLEATGNLFAYSDCALEALRNNPNMAFKNNAVHALASAVLHYSVGTKVSRALLAELDEVDLKGGISGNVGVDPDLGLDPASLVKYLKNPELRLDKALLAREIARAEQRLAQGGGGKTPGDATPKREPVKKDPTEEDPFADKQEKEAQKEPPRGEGKEDEGKPPADAKGTEVSGAYGQPYPPEQAWVFPASDKCTAGARQPK